MREGWSYCSLIARTMRSRRVISPSIRSSNRTYHYWHLFVPGGSLGRFMAIALKGRSDPANGLRFDPPKVLLDPYGRGVVVPKNYSRDAAQRQGDNAATAMKSVVVDPSGVRLGRRCAAATSVGPDHHLRDARARLHAPSQFRRCREDARHLCRPDRKDSVSPSNSASPRSNCCRCFSSMPRTARRAW